MKAWQCYRDVRLGLIGAKEGDIITGFHSTTGRRQIVLVTRVAQDSNETRVVRLRPETAAMLLARREKRAWLNRKRRKPRRGKNRKS